MTIGWGKHGTMKNDKQEPVFRVGKWEFPEQESVFPGRAEPVEGEGTCQKHEV